MVSTQRKSKVKYRFGLHWTEEGTVYLTLPSGVETGKQLWEKIKTIACEGYATDHWPAYERFVKGRHLIYKSETCRIESHNSNVRHYLARFRKNKVLFKVYKHGDTFATFINLQAFTTIYL